MILTIAQVPAPVSSLPAPPLLASWFLENPWPPAIGLVVAGLIAFLFLNRTGKARQGLLSLGAAAIISGGVVLLASAVTTDRERLRTQTETLVDAAADADLAALKPLLGDPVSVHVGSASMTPTRAAVLSRVEAVLGREYRVKEHRLSAIQAVVDSPTTARTQVRVWVHTDATGYDVPIGSWWRIDWRRESDSPDASWTVSGLTLMQLDGIGSLDSIRPYMP